MAKSQKNTNASNAPNDSKHRGRKGQQHKRTILTKQ